MRAARRQQSLRAAIVMAGLLGISSPAVAQSLPLPSPSAGSREAELEERLRRLESRYEAMERTHAEQYDSLNQRYQALVETLRDRGPAQGPPAAGGDRPRATTSDVSSEGGEGARDNPSEPSNSQSPGERLRPARAAFGPGFQISSDDDEFQLQFHNLTQIDLRLYNQAGQSPVHSGLSIPRQRWYFTGRMTRTIEFYTTINRGYGSLDLFDAFINFKYDDRFMFKVGRFKTPFSYEFHAMSAPDFLVPERSLFGSNFSPNRELGLMGWGRLFSERLDYAVGLFNGNRLSFQDTNEAKDVIAYLNARPFGAAADGGPWRPLKHLEIGGSVSYGDQNNAVPLPSVLRTSLAASNADDAMNVAPPWLAFNQNVQELGLRSLWGLHLAYFYKGLTLMAEWQSGFQSYTTSTPYRTKAPINSYYVGAGYFLTGETVDRRTQVEPLRPFHIGKGATFGPGAVELQGRYSSLVLGRDVFENGLADPNLWTNRVSTIDLGVNWYLNTYTKIVFEWEHAVFGDPVLYAPGRWQLTSDLFWMRFQVYF